VFPSGIGSNLTRDLHTSQDISRNVSRFLYVGVNLRVVPVIH
jgi:hypothetical protein